MDLESCRNVTIRNYTSFTGDDGIVLGSGNCNDMRVPWPEPAGAYTPTSHVTVDGAVLSSYSSAIKWEGVFQLSHGDVTDVVVRNTLIHDSARGVGMQQRTGGGAWRDVLLENVTVLRTKVIHGSNWWGAGEALWLTTLPETGNASATPLGGIHNVTLRNVVLEGEQGVVLAARDQGNATARGAGPGLSGVRLLNVTVRVGVYGNATAERGGEHDFRPVDAGARTPEIVPANVTGYWLEHAGDVAIVGGSVAFVGPAQRWWARGTCLGATPDSVVATTGMACTPA